MSLEGLRQILTKISTTQTYKWRDRALCKYLDTSVFYPDFRGFNVERYIQQNLPCAKCPVKKDCTDFADDNGEEWGIWGGEYRTPQKLIAKAAHGF